MGLVQVFDNRDDRCLQEYAVQVVFLPQRRRFGGGGVGVRSAILTNVIRSGSPVIMFIWSPPVSGWRSNLQNTEAALSRQAPLEEESRNLAT